MVVTVFGFFCFLRLMSSVLTRVLGPLGSPSDTHLEAKSSKRGLGLGHKSNIKSQKPKTKPRAKTTTYQNQNLAKLNPN